MRLHATIPLGLCLLCAAAVLPALAADSKDDAIKKDRMKVVGAWQVVSLEIDGAKADEENVKKLTIVNGADGTWVLESEGTAVMRGTSEIDPTKKPKTIDATVTEGDDKGQTSLGIYEIGDDERKVCLAKPGADRPDDFTSPAGGGRTLLVMKRLKK